MLLLENGREIKETHCKARSRIKEEEAYLPRAISRAISVAGRSVLSGKAVSDAESRADCNR